MFTSNNNNSMINLSFNSGKYSFEGQVITRKTGTFYTTRCTCIDLEGWGDTKEAAEESFKLVLAEYLEHVFTLDTIKDDLLRLGYSVFDEGTEVKAFKHNRTDRICVKAYTPDRMVQVYA